MCLMLYLASAAPIAAAPTAGLGIESVPDVVLARLRDKLSLPHVCLVVVGTCSCDFPQSGCDRQVEYEDWMGHSEAQRATEIASLRALILLVRSALAATGTVEIYPVWNNEEGDAVGGRVEARIDDLAPERFMFTEGFLYVLRA